jgi:hypothetical protein
MLGKYLVFLSLHTFGIIFSFFYIYTINDIYLDRKYSNHIKHGKTRSANIERFIP